MIPPEESTENRLRLLIDDELMDHSDADAFSRLRGICRVVARVVPASGVGVSLMSGVGAGVVAAASDPASEVIDELQFTLGEGPCVDAYSTRRPVLAEDLAGPTAARWPAYAPAVKDRGVEAVFAFPMQIGNACLGVLDLYRDRPGILSPGALIEAVTFARLALVEVLDGHERVSLWLSSDYGSVQPGPVDQRLVVHQAVGFLMGQLGVGAEEGLLRLRAHAFSEERRVSQVAEDIVARRLVLDRDSREPNE